MGYSALSGWSLGVRAPALRRIKKRVQGTLPYNPQVQSLTICVEVWCMFRSFAVESQVDCGSLQAPAHHCFKTNKRRGDQVG